MRIHLKKWVKDCNDCPFMGYHYDDYAISYDSLYLCSMVIENKSQKMIHRYDSKCPGRGKRKCPHIPSWCPLKEQDITVGLK